MDPSASRPSVARFLLAGLFVLGAATLLLDDRTRPVAAPLIATVASALLLVLLLGRRRRSQLVWYEIGLVYAGVVTLYAVYPLVGYLLLEQRYTVHNDGRLQQLAPDARTVGRIGWIYAVHLLAFVLSYLGARGRLPLRIARPSAPGLAIGLAALAFYVTIQGFWIVVGWFYDTSASSYIESYLVATRLPLILAQLLGHLSGAAYPLTLVLLVLLFSHYPRSRPVLIAWLAVTGGIALLRLGSRTELALFLFAAAVIYHAMVRRISARFMLAVAAAGILGFVAFGMARGGGVGAATEPWYLLPFSHNSDFEVIFGNAVHLDAVLRSGAALPLPSGFYLADVAALLPQQVAPYEKVDLSAWYVRTFFPGYAAAGGGLAFGLPAESVITGGWTSALARGILLGLLFAALHRLYARHANRLWVFVLYVWVTTLSYQAFRATTLYLLVPFVYRFLVAMVVVGVAAALLHAAARASRPIGQRSPPAQVS